MPSSAGLNGFSTPPPRIPWQSGRQASIGPAVPRDQGGRLRGGPHQVRDAWARRQQDLQGRGRLRRDDGGPADPLHPRHLPRRPLRQPQPRVQLPDHQRALRQHWQEKKVKRELLVHVEMFIRIARLVPDKSGARHD